MCDETIEKRRYLHLLARGNLSSKDGQADNVEDDGKAYRRDSQRFWEEALVAKSAESDVPFDGQRATAGGQQTPVRPAAGIPTAWHTPQEPEVRRPPPSLFLLWRHSSPHPKHAVPRSLPSWQPY
jgi:hypothetical protein